MPSGHFLDLDQWPRRPVHDFFRPYELPFFGICAEVRVTATRHWCGEHDQPFALACWFACQRAVNAVPEMRGRLRDGGRVWVHDRISISTTIAAPGDTFRFCHFPWAADFATFVQQARRVIGAAQGQAATPAGGSPLDGHPDTDAVIHGSTLPWIRFTGLVHARRLGIDDSVPKLVLGKVAPAGSAGHGASAEAGVGADGGAASIGPRHHDPAIEQVMPVAIEAHHALVDGLHVGRFLTHLEDALARPAELLETTV